MNEHLSPSVDPQPEQEVFPVEPYYHPIHRIPQKIYNFLASARLAMVLLVSILGCCVAGVTIWRGAEAGRVIFGTLWFNGLQVLLVINVACCFFGRVWHRRLTITSFGMILFHLSFVFMLLGIVYNSLFCFRGLIRLTEGEVLPSWDLRSYDSVDYGRFFRFSRLKGDTALIKMHTGYKVGGQDKWAAYEVAVGEGANKKQGMVYVTHKLTHGAFDYFTDKEGYSLLVTLSDRQGHIMYGGHIPLQSIRLADGKNIYASGYYDGKAVRPAPIMFPAPPEKPLMALQVEYFPSKQKERGGDAQLQLFPLDLKGNAPIGKPFAEETMPIGQQFAVGQYVLTAQEVRYWVRMTVRHEPGKPIVLASLWVGLAGMIITTVGRMLRKRR
ncbi:cytochrome c biogenesis protein ResB [Geotalea sp. SG265]|uniref:cytochrome c biogenesis protein ResB n=1 Tax=Geotalea sp. SG265 TaxID=2922867 RepID=UPI001FAE9991|nr:cytochrome c biogenesis protein ResB [Geotalea sp. SG265]